MFNCIPFQFKFLIGSSTWKWKFIPSSQLSSIRLQFYSSGTHDYGEWEIGLSPLGIELYSNNPFPKEISFGIICELWAAANVNCYPYPSTEMKSLILFIKLHQKISCNVLRMDVDSSEMVEGLAELCKTEEVVCKIKIVTRCDSRWYELKYINRNICQNRSWV